MITALAISLLALQVPDSANSIATRVEIVRTEYGVPHILAEDLEAMGFGLGYVQSEDFGPLVAGGLIRSRGNAALFSDSEHLDEDLDNDFEAAVAHARAVETWHLLEQATREVYQGFAEGVNHYIRLHRAEFPGYVFPDFTGIDALARDVQTWSRSDARRFVGRLEEAPAEGTDLQEEAEADEGSFLLDGSNAWALHGSRTASGKAILLRNPHLTWGIDDPLNPRRLGSRYYEAHVRVPGIVDFYGDFRIGTAFGIIGGFNRHLGWATTNNYPTYSQVYALERHPDLEDHVLLAGGPIPLEARTLTVDYQHPHAGTASESRTTWWTPFGPVIHRSEDRVYILKDPRDGEFRRGEQFLRMMRAGSLEEWLDVMRMRAHPSSNFTYADAAGNVVHYYNARLPLLPHEPTGDTAAFAASREDIWSEIVPWEELPLYVNPPGGYVQQANDTPDFTNLNVPLGRDTVAPNLPDPRLRLRSQLSLELIHGDKVWSLEDVVALKHSPRMLLAERVLDDLLQIAREDGRFSEPASVLEAWDRTAAAESRGGVLFERWAELYFTDWDDESRLAEPWDLGRPTETPSGIGDREAALEALHRAVASLEEAGLAMDVPWGDVHRIRIGDVDEPVSGCPPTFGCFRTLSFSEAEDGRRVANRGDAWVLFVEFGEVPRALSVLSYGQSPRPDSPHLDDQARMFARGEVKAVRWTSADIEGAAVRRYRPGDEIRR
jgi:acyl-homoserine-lactone acylase